MSTRSRVVWGCAFTALVAGLLIFAFSGREDPPQTDGDSNQKEKKFARTGAGIGHSQGGIRNPPRKSSLDDSSLEVVAPVFSNTLSAVKMQLFNDAGELNTAFIELIETTFGEEKAERLKGSLNDYAKAVKQKEIQSAYIEVTEEGEQIKVPEMDLSGIVSELAGSMEEVIGRQASQAIARHTEYNWNLNPLGKEKTIYFMAGSSPPRIKVSQTVRAFRKPSKPRDFEGSGGLGVTMSPFMTLDTEIPLDQPNPYAELFAAQEKLPRVQPSPESTKE